MRSDCYEIENEDLKGTKEDKKCILYTPSSCRVSKQIVVIRRVET
jgi:hypothetical protein